MYGFRKGFAAAQYAETLNLFGLEMDLKIALVTAQVVGYALSKIVGIKLNSEMRRGRRARSLILCMTSSWLALVLFALVPAGGKVFAILLSGLPLGLVWGLVLSFLEGRRLADLLGAGLSCSFIVASGAAKSVGTWLMNRGVSEAWMPAATGLVYFPPLLISVWMLRRIPHPTNTDVEARVQRAPMDRAARFAFWSANSLGLCLLVGIYTVLTVCRDFRDNFAPEMFAEHGIEAEPGVYVRTETPIALGVIGLVALVFLIRSNRRALCANHLFVFCGAGILGGSTLIFDAGHIDVIWWMVLNGFGLFLAYVPFNCIFFERLVACLGRVATSVFLIYVADSLGYVGVVVFLLYKNFGQHSESMLDFYRWLSYLSSAAIAVAISCSWIYFRRRSDAGP